ncbi:MAG: ATP-binding cassette domain-containing protein [Clostridia bacterium]|nr:ATP-binding cassette domain-containing protein [Clostridia bacterium]
MEAIKIEKLTKDFKSRRAVNELDLEIREGECFALLGQNGAGKTTTIKLLCCLLPPTSGEAFVFGKSILHEADGIKSIINVSPQETAIAPKLSVRENLELIAELYGVERSEARRRAAELLEKFGLIDRAKDRAKSLSGGLQRRLSIAMAIITEPKLLFLDEPTLGLDVRARRELWSLVAQLKSEMTVILTTHYMEEAEALCDRIAIMHEGVLRAVGTMDELKERTGMDNLEDIFLSLTGGEDLI